jgi:hypothetical protein
MAQIGDGSWRLPHDGVTLASVNADALAGITAKLDRADESLRALNDELAQITDSKPVTLRPNVDFQTGWDTFYIKHVEPLPPRPAVLAGEVLYQARSALEHLVWALVKANHKKPGKHNGFPIQPTRGKAPFVVHHRRGPIKGNEGGMLLGVSVGAATLIERYQPYHTPDPSRSFLAALNRMARDDRHHALHTVRVVGRHADMRGVFQPRSGYRIVEFETLLGEGRRLVAGTKLARLRAEPLTRNNQVEVHGNIPSRITLGGIEPSTLRRVNDEVRVLVSAFEKFL